MKQYLLILLPVFLLLSCGSDPETYTVKPETLYEGVYASGEIAPSEYRYIRPLSADRIYRIMVSEGDTIVPGQALVVMGLPGDDEQLVLANELVSMALRNTRDDETILREMQGDIETARKTWQQDSIDAARYATLAQRQAVSQMEAEKAETQALSSKNRYQGLQQQYQTRKRELQNKAIMARQEQARIRQGYSNKLLSSEIGGIVYSIDHKEGELVAPDQSIMLVGTAGKYKLELLVDERDIARLQIGQTVYFETDAFSDRQFEARISKINPVLQKDTRSFEVEATVHSDEAFYPQASVEANILLHRKEKALLIPQQSLSPEQTVQVRKGSEFVTRSVKTGLRAKGKVEVLSGLSEGDVIQIPSNE